MLGLPTDPLYAKAAEGILKNADNARIIDAVGRLKSELGNARAALGSTASSAELVAAASVVHAGVDVPALHGLWLIRDTRAKSTSFVMPLVVLSDLLARRVTPDVAIASLSTLLSHGARDVEFTMLRQTSSATFPADRRQIWQRGLVPTRSWGHSARSRGR